MDFVEIVAATRLTKEEFEQTALGLSLKRFAKDPRLKARIFCQNKLGLPVVYNHSIQQENRQDILIFMHDDVWIDDVFFIDQIIDALQVADIIGVAGNQRRVPKQPAWLFRGYSPEKGFEWDKPYLSGAIAHGKQASGSISRYGEMPKHCELIDGVFMAARKSVLRAKHVSFDPQFDFHFYDMDFCRTARQQGLVLSTWPISLTHQSSGSFGSRHWWEKYQLYLKKWGE